MNQINWIVDKIPTFKSNRFVIKVFYKRIKQYNPKSNKADRKTVYKIALERFASNKSLVR